MKKKHDVGGTEKMKVPMVPAGNVKGGQYSKETDSKPLADLNGTFGKPSYPSGSHRKTFTVGRVRGHHRND